MAGVDRKDSVPGSIVCRLWVSPNFEKFVAISTIKSEHFVIDAGAIFTF
ncbi:MAG: hypothetical protein IIU51_05085 [Bacteroidaceae bacterium]|nr:hypothetical protein [Bacteroidaceae bacterium]